jgi:hypothetical protein
LIVDPSQFSHPFPGRSSKTVIGTRRPFDSHTATLDARLSELAKKSPVSISLLAAANLFAALGSGKLLTGIMSFAADGDEHRFSALLVGTIIGLGILTRLPSRWKSASRVWLSLAAAGCSALLLQIYISFEHDGKLEGAPKHCFFALLCIRFSFWFVPRVLRSNLAAGYHQQISYVEMMYYVGVCAGLIMFGLLGLSGGVESTLKLDMILQITAATLDKVSIWFPTPSEPGAISAAGFGTAKYPWRLFCSLTAILASTTVGTQIVIFLLSHSFEVRHSKFSPDETIAIFYGGAAAAAILCAYWKPSLALQGELSPGPACKWGARICFPRSKGTLSVPFVWVAVICSALVVATLVEGFADHQSVAIVLFLISSGTVLYEIMFLVMLDRLGEERDRSGRPWLVSTAFGVVGSVAAASFIGIHHFCGVLSIWSLIGTVVLTLGLTLFVLLVLLKARAGRSSAETGSGVNADVISGN